MNINSSIFIPLQQQEQQQQQQQKHVAFSGNWRKSALTPSPPAAAANFGRWQHPVAAHFGFYKQQQQNFYLHQHHQQHQYHWSALQQQQQKQKATLTKHQQQPQQQFKKQLFNSHSNDAEKNLKISSTLTTTSATSATTKNLQTTTLQSQQQQPNQQLEASTKKKISNDTMQRNGSKTTPNNKKSHQQHHHQHQHHHHHLQRTQKQQNSSTKQDSTDSGISTTSSHQTTKKRRYGRNRYQCNGNTGINTDAKNGTATTMTTTTAAAAVVAATTAAAATTPTYSIKNWLGSEMVFCYENRFESSMAEDNLMPRHNPAHRSSTSSDMGASDDLNSIGKNKKMTSRQRRHHRRQQLENQTNLDAEDSTPMDIVGNEEKENCCPAQEHNDHNNSNCSINNKKNSTKQQQQQQQQQQQHLAGNVKSTAANLRKKCTTAAALKQHQLMPNNNCNITALSENNAEDSILQAAHVLSTSASYSSVCSSISSLSSSASSLDGSTSSASVASSATSTPAHSTSSSPTASPSISKRHFLNARKNKYNLSEPELVELLRPFIIQQEMLRVYGFPVESAVYKRCIEIYKCIPKPVNYNSSGVDLQQQQQQQQHKTPQPDDYQYHQRLTANAMYAKLKNRRSRDAHLNTSSPYDSSDSSEVGDGEDEPILTTPSYTDDGIHEILKQYDQSLEKNCMRCKRPFKVSPEGKYLTEESCQYHSGKLVEVYTGKCYEEQFTCCQRGTESAGCEQHAVHVWCGTVVGINGPYTDFEYTKIRYSDSPNVYALDCEMCITGRGLEVTKVTVIGYDGELVYEHFVLPQAPIVDYNTRYSGITAQDLDSSRNEVKTLQQVQRDLLELFDADTILIGHALENDLRALRIVHKTIVDTSIVFPAHHGFPYRRALKTLARTYLYRDIQCSELGHCSLEDSRACLDLMLYRVRHPV